MTYLSKNTPGAKYCFSVRPHPGISVSCKGPGWTKWDPFDQRFLMACTLGEKTLWGAFPPRLPLVSTPGQSVAGWPCMPQPPGIHPQLSMGMAQQRGKGLLKVGARLQLQAASPVKRSQKPTAISNLEGRQRCIESCGEGLTSARVGGKLRQHGQWCCSASSWARC